MTHKNRLHMIVVLLLLSAVYGVAITVTPQLARDAAMGYVTIILTLITLDHRGRK